jgi:hypothetical protein
VISRTRPIVTDQPDREIWKLIRLFLDERSTSRRIKEIHGISTKNHDSNVLKQARQIGQSIRQAEEYFAASRSVSTATRPLLLYYGAVSLARSLVLLRRDGSYSFDALRKMDRHAHHGLDLRKHFLSDSRSRQDPLDFLKAIACVLHIHESHDIPWGNFPIFYEALISPAIVVRQNLFEAGAATYAQRDVVLCTCDVQKLETLRERDLNLLHLMRAMPDMWLQLTDLEAGPTVCPGRVELQTTRHGGPADSTVTQVDERWDFYVNAIRGEDKESLKAVYARNPKIQFLSEGPTSLRLRFAYSFTPGHEESHYIPDIVDTMTGRHFYIVNPDSYIAEPAACLAMLFSLGMLSRYFPDVWMDAIDRNVVLAELLDSVLGTINRKFPQLLLDQLTGLKHYIQLA